MTTSRSSRPAAARRLATAALAVALVLAPALAEARLGAGSSFGSRGSRTFSAPPITSTAPRPASPFDRSMTQPSPNSGIFRPSTPGGGGFFGGGLGRGLLGGFLGAGLFGLLFGHGLFGGMGGIGSLFGLIIQLAILYFLFKLAMNWFRSRQPGYAGTAPGNSARTGFGGFGGPAGGGAFGGLGLGSGGAAPQTRPLQLSGADFDAFEQRLVEAQAAYSREDLDRLRAMSTPEIASYFAEQIADNARRGVVNKVTDVRFEKGDLSEAWQEGADDYATVAMRFSLIDATYERASNRLVEGDAQNRQTVTELWSFRRPSGTDASAWRISAIQQA